MSSTIRYLNRRFALAALALLVPAALATGAALLAQYDQDVRSRYATVFSRMGSELARLDIELARIALGEKAPDETATAEDAYREAIRIYYALRSSGEDAVVEDAAVQEAQVPEGLNRIARMLGVDALRDGIALGLHGHRMPAALDMLWEAREAEPGGAGAPKALETIIGEMLLQAAPVVFGASVGGFDGGPEARVEQARAWSLEQSVTNQRLRAIDAILDTEGQTIASMPKALTLLVFFASLVGVAITFAGVFRPLRSHVAKLERDLLAEAENAREAERAKSEFLANMSHEIRTPMNGVMGMAELLSKSGLDARQSMYVDVVSNSAKSLLTIINDILEFSKIDAGRMVIERKPLRLCEVADHSAALLSKSAFDKGVELMVRLDPALPPEVVGDFDRIRQVITNLLGNAVKFTERGEVVLDISLDQAPGAEDQPRLRIDVRDTGIGIPPAKLETVFGKFTQVDGSATRAHEGTGLGLAITRGLVELMDGRLTARSEPGVGSLFSASLPLVVSDAAPRATRSAEGFADKRVLVIDDNPTNRAILTESLSAWSMDAAAASGGREGLRALAAACADDRPFDIVLLDRNMPAMNGADVLTAMRADPALARTPVIAMCSLGLDATAPGEGIDGSNAMVAKPVSRAALHDQLAPLLSGAGMEALQTKPAPESDADDLGGPTPRLDDATNPPPVLVVEDNKINRLVALQMLGTFGLDAAVAENGREGLTAFRRQRPRLILMDVSMPLMNGLEATRAIREIEAANAMTPCHIVGLTAHAMAGDRAKCLDAGMNDYIAKPVSIERLGAVIADLDLAGSPERGEDTPSPPDAASV